MKSKLREKAALLRNKGFSFREISERLDISKSTASLWTRNIKLSSNAIKRLGDLSVKGRKKAANTIKRRREIEDRQIFKKVENYFRNNHKFDFKVACSLLYWCEGTKYKKNTSVSFMNADPEMIGYFLYLFRNSFDIDEKKLRALVHLHGYHNEKKQLKFWARITGIPLKQFNRSYLKKNTSKNKKENYPGCISIRYSDIKIYKELIFTIRKLVNMRG